MYTHATSLPTSLIPNILTSSVILPPKLTLLCLRRKTNQVACYVQPLLLWLRNEEGSYNGFYYTSLTCPAPKMYRFVEFQTPYMCIHVVSNTSVHCHMLATSQIHDDCAPITLDDDYVQSSDKRQLHEEQLHEEMVLSKILYHFLNKVSYLTAFYA